MFHPHRLALVVHWLAWFLPLGAYGVYDMLTRPPYGHGFEHGPEGAKFAVFISAIIATLYLPVIFVTLLFLGKIERTSTWRLLGLTVLAAWLSGGIFVGISFVPTDWLPNRVALLFGLAAVLLLAITTTAATILGPAKLGYIQRLKTKGFCASCRYDLRGTTGSQCPECGTAIPPNDQE